MSAPASARFEPRRDMAIGALCLLTLLYWGVLWRWYALADHISTPGFGFDALLGWIAWSQRGVAKLRRAASGTSYQTGAKWPTSDRHSRMTQMAQIEQQTAVPSASSVDNVRMLQPPWWLNQRLTDDRTGFIVGTSFTRRD